MEILAAFFDPSNNGFDIIDAAQVITLVVATSGIVAAVFRWNTKRAAAERTAEREAMKRELLDALKPIQPGYRNGGESLADLSSLSRLMLERQTDVIRDVRGIRERLDDHIDRHHDKES